MLKLQNIYVNYGSIEALRDVSLEVSKGSIVALLGSNGAGKSTTLKTISGLTKLISGKVIFDNENIQNLKPNQIVKKQIIHCPEGRQVFSQLTVLDNLRLGSYCRKDRGQIKKDLDHVLELFPRLKERLTQSGGTLSGGEQQMLAIGRALMGKPKLLLLDEPSLGLAPLIIDEIFKIIKNINKEGTSILLVEQNANLALSISDYAYILENGKVALSGKAKELKNNEKVSELYLGVKA
ncbi:MAG TPA: ABC transporter ATP-binding protein [Bacillales bacterium]|nr:ABC transporter ATP-binding protein [Bacillales bacterium]